MNGDFEEMNQPIQFHIQNCVVYFKRLIDEKINLTNEITVNVEDKCELQDLMNIVFMGKFPF
jgi:hypothetical protein